MQNNILERTHKCAAQNRRWHIQEKETIKKLVTRHTRFVVCLLLSAASASSTFAYHGAKNVDGKLVIQERGQTIVVEGWGEDSLRVRVTPSGSKQTSDWALDIPLESKGKVECGYYVQLRRRNRTCPQVPILGVRLLDVQAALRDAKGFS